MEMVDKHTHLCFIKFGDAYLSAFHSTLGFLSYPSNFENL